jgi:DNA invertase Pin-like site-specific DNA recombinase
MKRSPRGDPTLAVAYLRVSTEEQHLGPEAQRAAIEHWATRDRVTMVAWHTDAGVSGAAELQVRPGLGAALDDMKRLRAGVLVVARRDRLARDVVIAATIERAVTQRGGRVVSADGVGNGDAPADQFMRTILDGAAAYERALIRARTSAALKARRRRGERAGNVPWGYDADAVGKLSRDDEEHRAAERIHALRTEGRSLRAIVRVIAEEGFVARTGKALGLTQVARIVRERSATRAA